MKFLKSKVLSITLFCALLFISLANSGAISLLSKITKITNVGILVVITTLIFSVLVYCYLKFSGILKEKEDS